MPAQEVHAAYQVLMPLPIPAHVLAAIRLLPIGNQNENDNINFEQEHMEGDEDAVEQNEEHREARVQGRDGRRSLFHCSL